MNEVIIYNEFVTEGLSSNVFIVKNAVLKTAPIHTVLAGTMRLQVINACKQLNYQVIEELFGVDELMDADEVFVCSTSRFVVCGLQVDDAKKKVDIGLRIREVLEK